MSQAPPLPQLWDEPVDRFGGFGAQVFDAPGVLADNLLRARVFDAGLVPSRMAPEDRASIADRIKREAGDFPLVNAIVEVALNPWVWLGVTMSGAFKLPPVGRLFQPIDDYLATVRNRGYLLTKWGFNTATSEFAGTDMLPLLRELEDGVKEVWDSTRGVQESRTRLGALLGLRHLSDDDKLAAAIQAKLHGLDVAHTEQRFQAVPGKGGAAPTMKVRELQREALLDGRKLDAYLESKGATEYVGELQSFYRNMWQRMFGRDGQPDVVDTDKVRRWFRSQKKGIGGKKQDFGDGAISTLFGDDMADALKAGTVTEDQFRGMISQAFERQAFYAPMQKTRMYWNQPGRGPVKMGWEQADIVRNRLRRSGAEPRRTSQIEPRVMVNRIFDPDDLVKLRDFKVAGGSESAFERAYRQGRHLVLERGGETDELWGMVGLDADKAFDKYTRQAARGWAMHARPVSNDVWEAVAESRERMKGAIDPKELSKGVWETAESVNDVPKGTPEGGWTLFDVMRGSYQTIRDPHSQRQISEVIIPTVTGTKTLNEGLLTGSVGKMKEFAETAFHDGSALAGILDQAGAGKLRKGLLKWGQQGFDRPLVVDRGVASYFYGSTIGANIATVLVNMTQPLLTTARGVPVGDVLAGYGEAVKGMVKYAGLRTAHLARYGTTRRGLLLGPENAADKARMVRESFGEIVDTANIGPQFDEILETMTGPRLGSIRVGPLAALENANEFLLKAFEKGEWINRATTAYAVRRAAIRQGLDPRSRVVRNQIRDVVETTQFVAEPLNTPIAFLDADGPASALTNPIFRQFLTFPTRMLTGLAEGQRRGKGLERMLDLSRAMAMGAVTYEVGKELFGADLAPATILGATLGVARESGPFAPFPAPPTLALGGSVFQTLATQDLEYLRYTIPTLIPGGVGLSRALGILPEIPVLRSLPVQRYHVDWENPSADGRYGVYNREGRLISWETEAALLARAAGLDMGRFQDEGEMIRYLANIREETIQYEREYLLARMKNQHEKALSIKRRYESRFGLHLDISSAQVDAFRNSRVVSRIERTMQSLPKAIRDRANPIVAQTLGERLGMSPEEFMQGSTIRQRDPWRRAELSGDFRAELENMVEERREAGRGAFQPFTPFGVAPAPGVPRATQ